MGGNPIMRTAWVLMIGALVIMATTAWVTPSAPFNGLSLIALVMLGIAGYKLTTKGKQNV